VPHISEGYRPTSGRRKKRFPIKVTTVGHTLYGDAAISAGLRWVLMMLQYRAHSWNRPTATDEKIFSVFSVAQSHRRHDSA